MSEHPYRNLPFYAFWNRSMAGVPMDEVDPVVKAAFQIHKSDKVATAGSCFAQHIARHLQQNGFNYFIAEREHPITPPHLMSLFNYRTFSARFGNIYTARQLLQLFRRAYDQFQPQDDVWLHNKGYYVDAFRPQIQPGGFLTKQELLLDRKQHLRSVRQMFEQLDVFIFTLGLTECWFSKVDGAVYPLCPGVAGGEFSSDQYEFVNLGVDEVVEDMLAFIKLLRGVNSKSKIVLTVSPVPLIATAEDQHVLVSTAYSKAVLRVAAEQIVRKANDTAYFPSYEIITGNHSCGSYFAPDLRSVQERGVQHVMRLFLKYYAGCLVNETNPVKGEEAFPTDGHTSKMMELVEVNCDEIALEG